MIRSEKRKVPGSTPGSTTTESLVGAIAMRRDDPPQPGNVRAVHPRVGATVYLSQQAPAYAWIFDPGSHAEMAEWSATVSNSWRPGTDIANADQPTDVQWQTIVTNLDYTLPLIAGNGISLGEPRVQFGAWAMLSDDVVVSRDDAARDAAVSWSTAMSAEFVSRSSSSALMVMLKPLNDGRWAILVANLGAGAPAFAISLDSLAPAGVPVPATVTNVFTSEAVTDVEVIEGEVPPRDAAMYIVDIA